MNDMLLQAHNIIHFEPPGVTLADIDPQFGKTALMEIKKEFGANKAIFTKTDVTDIQQFEGLNTWHQR
ncbi:hypothetical protein NQ318_021819 [Aromia moschata]|uniref:Uncharacterized protein n=1 Tax=Aromia moschata TaxID=1265417 RepID=A0AAV8Z6I3_9CUCU|nr:hypothetical protein NQ318_021819 [Aromia moschata]